MTQTVYKKPLKLYTPSKDGTYLEEHIPSNHSLTFKIRSWLLNFKFDHGINVYYWDFRFLYLPKERKARDLAFIVHVLNDHNGQPSDKKELRHYGSAIKRYQHEVDYFIYKNDDGRVLNLKEVKFKHPYEQAYKKQWGQISEIADFKRLYHGINRGEFIDIVKRDVNILNSKYPKKYLKPSSEK